MFDMAKQHTQHNTLFNMKNVKTLLAVLSLLFAFSACNREDKPTDIPAPEKRNVTFTSSIGGENYTRASNASWDTNDKIGVFMKTAGQTLSSSSILSFAENIPYITTNRATFDALYDSEKISYPDNGAAVDFIAYYPYQTTISSFIYKVNVSNQSSQEAIDLLYSNNSVNQNKNTHQSNLVFSHQLAKIKIVVETGSGISTLNGLSVNISGVASTADFDLTNGGLTTTNAPNQTIALNITDGDNGKKVAEAVLIPDNGENERTITFALPSGRTFKHKIAAGTKLEKNTRYSFSVTLKDDNPVVEPVYGYVETPKMTNLPADQQYVLHMMSKIAGRNFAMLYDTKYKLAYWVAYPLVPSYHVKNTGRTDDWGYDPKIKQSFQPNLSSGWATSGIDRGHQIPSGDRTCGDSENAMTFYYSNMTAQNSKLNQGQWAKLEEKTRAWASRCDTMYVVTGAMIQTKTDKAIEYASDKSGNQIARPKYYYRALAQRTGNTYTTIAFKMDNKEPSGTYDDYRLTVKELEDETGFTFFPSLSNEVKGKIEANKWN